MTRRAPGAMPCPRCDSHDTELATRRGRPVYTEDGGVLRGHRCHACGHLFVSIQRIVTDADIEAVA